MRDGFLFYKSFAEALAALPAEQYKAIMTALCAYALDDEQPEGLDPICAAMFTLIKPQIDANNKRFENGKLGGRPKTKTEPSENQTETKPKPNNNQTQTKPKPNENQTETKAEPKEKDKEKEKDKDKENKEREIYKEKEKEKRFIPPTVEEVRRYILERHPLGNSIDPQQFVDFYTSKGWKVGKEPMKDWRACVRTWERRSTREPPASAGIQRETDYDRLVRRIHEPARRGTG